MLGEKIKARRTELRMSISTAARAASINRNTWSAVEKGERNTEDYTYGGIERALGWRSGSIAAILNDDSLLEDPQHAAAEPGNDRYANAEAELRAIRDNLNRPQHLRAWAQSQLDQIAAIREAVRAEDSRNVS